MRVLACVNGRGVCSSLACWGCSRCTPRTSSSTACSREMLWACHVASLLIAIGILAHRGWLVAVGTVFHLAVGVPAYAVDVIALGQTTLTSVLAHTVPPFAGLLALRDEAPWPRWTPVAAGALYVALIPISRWLTEPALNVNLAFTPWPPLATLIPSPWATWLGNVAGMARRSARLRSMDSALVGPARRRRQSPWLTRCCGTPRAFAQRAGAACRRRSFAQGLRSSCANSVRSMARPKWSSLPMPSGTPR